MVIVDSLDERLLDCAFCGKRFFDTPDMALFGWDDDAPIYICMACDTVQQQRAVDGGEVLPPHNHIYVDGYCACGHAAERHRY